jgi:putative transposase
MRDWPHSPLHRLAEQGAYMVTAGTASKDHFFNSSNRLSLLHDALLELATRFGWNLQAWAVFSNHYHFVAVSPPEPESLRSFIRHLHSTTAIEINRSDGAAGRKVWFQYWDTQLTFEKSYFARLNYVHSNAVHHGLVRIPSAYPWCSAGWFERKADRAFYKRIMNLPTDRVHLSDDYAPIIAAEHSS